MIRMTMVVGAALASVGCASVVNDSTHPVRVETKTPAGKLVSGAEPTATAAPR